MHVTLARELASQLGGGTATGEPGAYYLGATTPDIRVLTRWDRDRTHFFDLDDFGEQRGIERFFAANPDLADAGKLGAKSRAFLCGYLSHLEMDEVWINDIYRPCFGERSPLKGDVLANLLDRVLQFELDKRERDQPGVMPEICDALQASTVDEAIGFLDLETLLRWRETTAVVLEQPQPWDRFGVIAGRHLRAYGVESEDDLAHFLKDIPDLLQRSIREVTPERIEAFQSRSRRRALEAMRAFLS